MRFLVTGGRGMLGREFARAIAEIPGAACFAPGKDELDVRDGPAMQAAARHAEQGWVVHCGAMVSVEACARDPRVARDVIVGGAANAIETARSADARLFYPQSFLTYDGKVNPIAEDEERRPLSLYGELKSEAQSLVERAFGQHALVVCMAGFFGGEEADKNFIGRIIPLMHAAILRGERTFDVGDRVWQPTWTRDLAFNSLQLMLAGSRGRYQMASHGEASFAAVAEQIVHALGWTDRLTVVPVAAAGFSANELGRRPDRAVLSCSRLRAEKKDLQRDWRATLEAYLRHPYFDRYRFL